MKTSTKVWLIVAAVFVLAGSILFTEVMTVLNWDFSKLSTVKYETNTYTVSEEFTHVSVAADTTADVTFAVAEDNAVTVVCYEEVGAEHTVGVENGMLMVNRKGTRKWYQHIGIHFRSPRITVYLPAGTYGTLMVQTSTGDVSVPADFAFDCVDIAVSTGHVTCGASATQTMKIQTTTGHIRLSDLSAGSLALTVSTGRIDASAVTCDGDASVAVSTGKAHLTDVTCRNLSSSGSTGDLTLKNVIATEAFTITRSTGDVTFDACDAASLTVTTDTGNIKGSLLTEKVFITHTDTGRVDVPESTEGGKCKLTTDTGDIKITVR